MDIPIYYDPMIAKLIAWGENREAAILRILEAIEQYHIEGVATTLPFGKFVFEHPAFISGQFDTHFVNKHFHPEHLQAHKADEAEIAAFIALDIYLHHRRQLRTIENPASPLWKINRERAG
jgi:propionyl-CoA carboxylase alpha chain